MSDPLATSHNPVADTAADLAAEGFDDAHEVGRGGFGVVYRCTQTALDRTVAIKILTSDPGEENRERFLREQRAMGRLSGHPNIVEILQTGVTRSGLPYIVMPYHSHQSLDRRVRSHGPVPWQETLRIGIRMAGALETAHHLGMLHRDVKPANILFTDYGEPQLCDFGIARVQGGFETQVGNVAGSPAFTAPEVLRGRTPTRASDVYGLGATLFAILTGHAAFERRTGERLVSQFLRITTEPIPDLREDGVPDSLSAAIERAMAENPSDRFPTAAAFGEALRAIQRDSGLEIDSIPIPQDGPPEVAGSQSFTVTESPHSNRRPVTGTTTPPTAATKYRPPTPTHALVRRSRALAFLRDGGRRRLALIHAPPGFGKTTLAAQWRGELIAEDVPVAWLNIDADDDNVVWFLAHLVEAIRFAAPTLAHELGQILQDRGDEAQRYVLTSLIDEIHSKRIHLVVMIDDWHNVRDQATIDAMGFLLENSCHHLQILVTSRTKSGLPLSTLLVRDELVEIDSTALRFDYEEARTFLHDSAGTELSEQDLTLLEKTTDGWVAALQLASVSLRGAEDPSSVIGGMTGRHHAIGQYLAENVFAGLDDDLLDFMLSLSVPDRVCASLASALTGVEHPQALLEELEEHDLFLHADDASREWFRFDTVFAEFLRRRLARDRPGRIEELHRAAARWFAKHRLHGEAIDNAVAAHDDEFAANLVEAQGTYLLEHSRMTTLLGLVAKLSPAVVATRPRLQMALTWANILLQHTTPARAALNTLEGVVRRTPEADLDELRAEADVARAVMEVAADRVSGVDLLIFDVLENPESVRPWVVSAAANVSSFASVYRFEFARARRMQDWAVPFHQQAHGSFGLVYGHCFAGIAATEQLDIAAAEDHFRIALQAAEDTAGPNSHSARLAGAMLGGLLYELGDIETAEKLLDAGYELGPEGGVVDFMIARFVTAARVKATRGDVDGAVCRLDAGLAAADALGLPRLRARIENERVRFDLPYTPERRPRRGADHAEARADPGIVDVIEQLEEATELRRLLRTDPTAASRRAAERVGEIDEHRRPLAHLQAKRLLAACQVADHHVDDAKTTVAEVAAVCSQIGFTRYLIDGGPAIMEVLALLHADGLRHEWSPEWPHVPLSYLAETLQLVERS
ncbi:protein kinase [Rhodococcus sp. NPDC058521]|uniref:protein kinase domain-containing protein n=1 Tax=Rhodococcus sp. NPDC058521 TaxID=3346536 RepID=UPI0036501F8E